MAADPRADLDRALQDPQSVFDTPEAVLASDLSRDDKLAVLRRWENDARELSVATEENMAGDGGDEAGMLAEVRQAILRLEQDAAADDTAAAPTKHGG